LASAAIIAPNVYAFPLIKMMFHGFGYTYQSCSFPFCYASSISVLVRAFDIRARIDSTPLDMQIPPACNLA